MKKFFTKLITCATLVCCMIISLASSYAQEWTVMKPMPTARQNMLAAATDGYIYVFSGSSMTGLYNTTEAYSIASNSWKTCASIPTARGAGAAEAVDGKIYVIGGYNAVALDVVEIYDPATDTWTTGTPMPTPRSEIFSCVIDGKIYITGGWPSEYSQLEIYDPATDSWSTGTSCPLGIIQHNSGVAHNGKFYAIGGKNYAGSTFYNSNYVYDPESDEWALKAGLPEELFAGDGDVLNNNIHYFGGSRTNMPYINFDKHYVYNAMEDEWSAGLVMPERRANHVAVAAGDAIYVIGGVVSCDTCTPDVTAINERYSEPQLSISGRSRPEMKVSLYPIPAFGTVTITTEEDKELKKVRISDIAGREVYRGSFSGAMATIDISKLEAGFFTVYVEGAKGRAVCKIVAGN